MACQRDEALAEVERLRGLLLGLTQSLSQLAATISESASTGSQTPAP